ncbi:YdcH family protein [Neomegalonema perideroedes]|uniref:YdcH family protein n=1 Tax=Neomegalonema perideroedes TaxID=217219 RepID=UPI0003756776|nr:DUF465 domain-containing protein [Neomegalonema perideroedes]
MSLANHVKELEKKHKALEDAISTAVNRPAADDLEIQSMKREKLRLKEEIARHAQA